MIEGSENGSCELRCLFGRKGPAGTTGNSLTVLDVRVENDGADSETGKEAYEDGRVKSSAVDINDSGVVFGWDVRCGPACGPAAAEEIIAEGTIDGVLYGFVEEKWWLAK